MTSLDLKQPRKPDLKHHKLGGGSGGKFHEFAREAFRGNLSETETFSRTILRQPLLRITSDEEKENAISISKVLLIYMGDMVDYRTNMEYTYQPNMGTVMGRLYQELGISVADEHLRRHPNLDPGQSDEESLKHLPNKPRKGTFRKLKNLTLRLSKNKKNTIFHQLPIEDTLRTQLEQIQFIIGLGILKPELRAEIYCQICRQLSHNPIKMSVKKGWMLLQLVAGCFAPPETIRDSFVDFLQHSPPLFAPAVLKVVERTVKNGTRFQPPAQIEVDAVWERKPLDLQVTFMDGTQECLVADSSTTSRELVHRICSTMGVNDRFGFSIFISLEKKVASLGNGEDKILDAISQCEQSYIDHGGKEGEAPWHLYFRKEIFTPWEKCKQDITGTNLIYAQVVRGIMLGEYVCHSDEDLALLAARQYYVEYGIDITQQALKAVLQSYIPHDWRQNKDQVNYWLKTIIATHLKVFPSRDERQRPSSYDVKVGVVNKAKADWPNQFSRYYDAVRVEGSMFEEGVRLAVNSAGLSLETHEGSSLYSVSYPEISSISSSQEGSHSVMFLMVDGASMKVHSPESWAIHTLVTYMMDGLRDRSRYAVAVQAYTMYTDSSGEMKLEDGELLLLSKPAGQDALKSPPHCTAQCVRTGISGLVKTSQIYVLPTLTEPSQDLVQLFRSSSQQRGRFDMDHPGGSSRGHSHGDDMPDSYSMNEENVGDSYSHLDVSVEIHDTASNHTEGAEEVNSGSRMSRGTPETKVSPRSLDSLGGTPHTLGVPRTPSPADPSSPRSLRGDPETESMTFAALGLSLGSGSGTPTSSNADIFFGKRELDASPGGVEDSHSFVSDGDTGGAAPEMTQYFQEAF